MWKYSFIVLCLSVTQATLAFGQIVIEDGSLIQSSDDAYYDGPLGDEPYDQPVSIGHVEWSGLASPIRYAASVGYYHDSGHDNPCDGFGHCEFYSWEIIEHHEATASFSLSSAGVFQVTPDPNGDLGLEISNPQTDAVLHSGAMNTLPENILLPPGTWGFLVSDINAGTLDSSSSNSSDEETGSSHSSSSDSYDASGWVQIINTVLTGPVITIGDVDPGGTGVQPNPWNVDSNLVVGKDGNGTLEITAGGEVSNLEGYIGHNSGATGQASISGPHASWQNSGNLHVGHRGTGRLDIGAQSVVSNEYGYIGTYSTGPGVVSITGTNAGWENKKILYVGYYGDGELNVTNGGRVISKGGYISRMSGSSSVATVSGADSVWDSQTSIRVAYKGTGSLIIEDGGAVTNTNGYIGDYSTAIGIVTVTGNNSLWNNSQNLVVGDEGTATLNIGNGGRVIVGDTTSIGPAGSVNLTGGRFEFGQMSLEEFSMIHATGGALAGNVPLTGVKDVALLTSLQNSAADLNNVVADNSGLLHGSATLTSSLNNWSTGEVRLLTGNWMRIEGSLNLNTGEINNFGGMVEFSQDLTNQSGGFIGGRGQFIADDGWTNQGVMAFAGTTDILGDINNQAGGQIVTSGGATTTIYDDVINNTGAEINTGSGSHTVIFGAASGEGNYTGAGTVHLEGDLQPGNSPAMISFGGDVVLGASSTTQIEIGGIDPGEFDQLNVAGSASLAATLDAILIDGFSPALGQTFTIISAEDGVVGTFDTTNIPALGEGLFLDVSYHPTFVALAVLSNLLLGDANNDNQVTGADLVIVQQNFGNVDANVPTNGLFPGDANDDGQVTGADIVVVQQNFGNTLGPIAAAVPEPASASLITLVSLGVLAHRRRIVTWQ